MSKDEEKKSARRGKDEVGKRIKRQDNRGRWSGKEQRRGGREKSKEKEIMLRKRVETGSKVRSFKRLKERWVRGTRV